MRQRDNFLHFILLVFVFIRTNDAIKYFVSAPNVFRLDTPETVAISVTEHNVNVEVRISIWDQAKKKELDFKQELVTIGSPKIVHLTVKNEHIKPALKDNEVFFVNLVVRSVQNVFPEKSILVPVKMFSGYVYIQTSKPLYTPKDKVQMRVLYLTENLVPNDKKYTLEIKDPKGDLVHQEQRTSDRNGINNHKFDFPTFPRFGNWSVSVIYGHKNDGKTTVKFELREYVLPTFSVRIEVPKFILNDAHQISVKVISEYVYGKPVIGKLTVKFGIKKTNGDLIPLFQRPLLDINGVKSILIDVDDDIIAQNIVWFPQISGNSLYVDAVVVETATGNRQIAIDDSCIFTLSPFNISFERSIADFKPGVPYQLQVDVKLINGEIAKNVRVYVIKAVSNRNKNLPIPQPMNTNELGHAVFEFNTGSNDHTLQLTVSTSNNNADVNRVKESLTVTKYNSPDGASYVWISAPPAATVFKVGEPFQTTVTVHPVHANIKIHYMVVSRGKILVASETAAQTNAFIYSIQFVVTADMGPTARLLVYIVKNNKIIADSLRFEVEEKCKYNEGRGFRLSIVGNRVVEPGKKVILKIEAEPRSHVGILAIDEAVYLLNKQGILTKQMMFKEIMSHDLGCGPGGGRNSENVFDNAGLLIMSNAEIGKLNRIENCATTVRKKRSIIDNKEVDDVKKALIERKRRESQYTGVAAACCRIGRLRGPIGMNCTARAEKIEEAIGDKDNCSVAFLDCCKMAVSARANFSSIMRNALQSDDEQLNLQELIDLFEGETLKQYRWYFPEVWLFNTYEIGRAPCKGRNTRVCEVELTTPHSITTWQIQGFGISQTSGLCIAEPIKIPVMKNIFIQMELPYSAVRKEQILIPITVFNYNENEITAHVYILGLEGLCTGVSAGEKTPPQTIAIPGNNVKTVTIAVMPLELAAFPIKAVVLTMGGSDSVEKTLNVIPEGKPVIQSRSMILDPAGVMKKRQKRSVLVPGIQEDFDKRNNKQMITVNIDPPEDIIPGTDKCVVKTMGEIIPQAVISTIQGLDQAFFKIPTGCGEQTMSNLAPLVYTMMYLKQTDRLAGDLERNGYQLLNQGYSNIMNYKKFDGGFAVWAHYEPSTWLTAFVVKILCQANEFINIPQDVRCGAVNWFYSRQQDTTGQFYDPRRPVVYMPQLLGGVQSDVTVTAFVLIAMFECKDCISPKKRTATFKATAYLERQLDSLTEPHALSIVTYALTLANSKRKGEANQKLRNIAIYNEASDTRFWNWNANENRASAIAVETTSYALLTQLLFDDIAYSHPIANWLTQQRSSGGEFMSTQDTVIGLQALSEYAFHAKFPALDLICNITSQAKAQAKRNLHLTEKNALILQQNDFPVGGNLLVDVSGKGIATMNVLLHYNEMENKDKICKFELTVNPSDSNEFIEHELPKSDLENDIGMLPEGTVRAITSAEDVRSRLGVKDGNDKKGRQRRPGKSYYIVRLQICTKYLNQVDSPMAILDIGLFTGFKFWETDLTNLLNDESSPIEQYEESDRSIKFYLAKVPHNKNLCINLRTYQNVSVGIIQPARVHIYNYYEPDESCEKFYSPVSGSALMTPLCEGEQCRCLDDKCPLCKPFEEVKNTEKDEERRKKLLQMACNKHDFVWNGTVFDIVEEGNFINIEFIVTHILKGGVQKDSIKDDIVVFTTRKECTCLNMKKGKSYIIMSRDGFPFKERGDTKYKYTIDHKTSVRENIPLRLINDIAEKNLQKNFFWLFNRMAIKKMGCDT